MPVPFSEGYIQTLFINKVIPYMIRTTQTELRRNKTYKDFLIEHNEEIRLGKLIRVVERLGNQSINRHKKYQYQFCRDNRIFDLWIRDESTTTLFSISLYNINVPQEIMDSIIEFYELENSWVKRFYDNTSKIGKNVTRQHIEKDFKNGVLKLEDYVGNVDDVGSINWIWVKNTGHEITLEDVKKLSNDEFKEMFKEVYEEYFKRDTDCYRNLIIDPRTGRAINNRRRNKENMIAKPKQVMLKRKYDILNSGVLKFEDEIDLVDLRHSQVYNGFCSGWRITWNDGVVNYMLHGEQCCFDERFEKEREKDRVKRMKVLEKMKEEMENGE